MAHKKPTIPPPAAMGIDDPRREKFATKAHEARETKAHERAEGKRGEAREHGDMPRKKF